KRAYCLKTQPATGETYPKSDLFNKASKIIQKHMRLCWPNEISKTLMYIKDNYITALMPLRQESPFI
ncbi:hypothetical protein ACRFDU_15595, partial [Klebsiella pneumoniae]